MLNVSTAVKIRHFSRDDVGAILGIQKLCTPAAVWRQRDYEQLADDPRGMVLVAELEACMPPGILGFSVAYRVDEEAELWNIAVTPRHRRGGIARSLLQEVCRKLAGSGVQRLLLEVRESNIPAKQLYDSLGFTHLLTRKDYYHNPAEDALVLARKIGPNEV